MESKRIHLIYGSLYAFLFIISTLALILAISDVNYDSLAFSLDKAATLIGIFVSTVGLFISPFLVILAFNAYSKIKEIGELKNIAEKEIKNAQQSRNKLDLLLKDNAQSLYDNFEAQIALADLSGSESIRNNFVLSQARLSYKCPMLDKEIRLPLLLLLADIGEVIDVNKIEYIVCSDKEESEIKEYAMLALEELKKRLNI